MNFYKKCKLKKLLNKNKLTLLCSVSFSYRCIKLKIRLWVIRVWLKEVTENINNPYDTKNTTSTEIHNA